MTTSEFNAHGQWFDGAGMDGEWAAPGGQPRVSYVTF